MTTALEVMERASRQLQDAEFVRWTKEEMLDWLSEAQIAIARTPGAYPITRVVQLQHGTRQFLPSDGWHLITITRNFDGNKPREPVRLVTRHLLDACVPNWHMLPEFPLVENYTYDDRTPKEFYVFPPNDGYGSVEIVYSGIPNEITSEDDELVLDDTYIPAIVSYVIYRANCKESDYSAGIQSAVAYFQSYNAELAGSVQARGVLTPNSALQGGVVNPNGGTE